MFLVAIATVALLSAWTTEGKINFYTNTRWVMPSLTEKLSVSCSLEQSTKHIRYLKKIEVFLNTTKLARISQNGKTEDAGNHKGQPMIVKGKVTGQKKFLHLEVEFANPGQNETGMYRCNIQAVDDKGNTRLYRDELDVQKVEPSLVSLAKQIRRNSKMTKEISKIKEDNAKIREQIANMKGSHIENGYTKCKSTWKQEQWPYVGTDKMGSKIYADTVDVRFSKPYKTIPKVFVGVAKVDQSNEANGRYGFKILSVSKLGFKAQCFTWNDSRLYYLSFNWISFAGN